MAWCVHPIRGTELITLQDSVDEGLRLLEQGKVSGEKLVYRIADTPTLQ
jgi:hypothetical protein